MKPQGPGGGSNASRRPRRSWPTAEKRKIIAESFAPGASVAQVAQRYGLNANMLFTWRRRFRPLSAAASVDAGQLVPVSVSPEPSPTAGRMEIVLIGGERICVGVDVDALALARIVKVLSRR
jgi:transposase